MAEAGKIKSQNALARELREAGTTSVLAYLQMSTETDQVINHILACSRNAIRRLSAFLLINKTLRL